MVRGKILHANLYLQSTFSPFTFILTVFFLLFSSHFGITLIVCCDSFHGSKVAITALPYKPYWVVEDGGDVNGTVRYSGSDRQMLETIASVLNFTINVLPVTTWAQVSGHFKR